METKWIQGRVVRGEGRGKDLGFPTANIELDNNKSIPPEGVYAAWVRIMGRPEEPSGRASPSHSWAGAAHIGPRPTFEDAKATIEIHILDFPPQDIYGVDVTFTLVDKIRGVKKFGTIPELVAAITEDCNRVRELLAP